MPTNKKIIFTNGCFDLIHVGHIELLKYASSLGKVVVGLNSDESVKRLKGISRPINNELDRKKILEAISYVNEVIIFNEDTPYDLIKQVKPDIVIKGGDYVANQVIGADICKVIIFPFIPGKSTTNILKSRLLIED